jgi:glycosyltransferase involved in cell wall biosynthesis
LKILFINYEYPPIGGGASNATFFMAKAMKDLGNEVSVMTAAFGELKGYSSEEENIHIYRIKAKRAAKDRSNMIEMLSFVMSAFWQVGGIIRQQKIEKIIIFFSIPCGVLGPYIRWRWKLPYIISLRGGDVPGTEPHLLKIHYLIRPIRQYLMKKAKAIVANSKGLAELSQKYDPFAVKIIPNGVDTHFFYPEKSIKSKFYFLFVGRFQPQKNLFVLLKSFANVLQNADNQDIMLVMVGDGFQKNELQNYAQQLGINHKIEWRGWLDKPSLRKTYQEADCVLNPSTYEGMPNVLLEAMACGVPAIASNIMGNDEVIKHGHNGFLFELSKPEDMVHYMMKMMDKNLQSELAQNARCWVSENFSWHTVAESYANIF